MVSIDASLKEELQSLQSFEVFLNRLFQLKMNGQNIPWTHMEKWGKDFYGVTYSESYYRRHYKEFIKEKSFKDLKDSFVEDDDMDVKEEFLKQFKEDKEKIKLSDERNQIRAYIRKLAREEVYKDSIVKAVGEISSRKSLSDYKKPFFSPNENRNEGILCISDWHFGIDCNNAWNIYNEDVAVQRVSRLRDEVINKCTLNNVNTLHVLNLGDMIAGLIHLTLRLESREDVISQTMKVSELLAELLADLSNYFKIEYYSCSDNHSRIWPNKNDALDTESLTRIIDWYLAERLKKRVHFNKNTFGEDIITFNVKGFKILGVHGDKDRPEQIIDSISRMTESHYDLICTAHRHHFSCDEKNRTIIVANSSLMGTDTFAKNLRLSAFPSQNLIIVSDTSACEAIYRIVL